MKPSKETERGVLKAIGDDMENLEQIYNLIRKARPISLAEVANAVHRMMKDGLIVARMDEVGQPMPGGPPDASHVWRAWFALSSKGRDIWARSVELSDAAATMRPSLSPPGGTRSLGPNVDEYREAWREIPRDPRRIPD